MSAHTPGPWHAMANGASRPLERIGVALPSTGGGYDSHCIALLWPTFDEETTSSNARLIAAAPDLLAMLKEAREWVDQGRHNDTGTDCHVCERIAQIDAVIAKAEGRA